MVVRQMSTLGSNPNYKKFSVDTTLENFFQIQESMNEHTFLRTKGNTSSSQSSKRKNFITQYYVIRTPLGFVYQNLYEFVRQTLKEGAYSKLIEMK